jgi:hypothetical protein
MDIRPSRQINIDGVENDNDYNIAPITSMENSLRRRNSHQIYEFLRTSL